jgi:hypothetical protein
LLVGERLDEVAGQDEWRAERAALRAARRPQRVPAAKVRRHMADSDQPESEHEQWRREDVELQHDGLPRMIHNGERSVGSSRCFIQ